MQNRDQFVDLCTRAHKENTVAQLKAKLTALNMKTSGSKSELCQRLASYYCSKASGAEDSYCKDGLEFTADVENPSTTTDDIRALNLEELQAFSQISEAHAKLAEDRFAHCVKPFTVEFNPLFEPLWSTAVAPPKIPKDAPKYKDWRAAGGGRPRVDHFVSLLPPKFQVKEDTFALWERTGEKALEPKQIITYTAADGMIRLTEPWEEMITYLDTVTLGNPIYLDIYSLYRLALQRECLSLFPQMVLTMWEPLLKTYFAQEAPGYFWTYIIEPLLDSLTTYDAFAMARLYRILEDPESLQEIHDRIYTVAVQFIE